MTKAKVVKVKTEVCTKNFWSGLTSINSIEKWVVLPAIIVLDGVEDAYIKASLRDQYGTNIHINPIEIIG